jgi:isopenicillin N synthase-like dioxygenase
MASISCDSSSREDGNELVNKGCNLSFNTVKYLSEVGVKELPRSYVLPEANRPNANSTVSTPLQYDLPVIDISGLEGPDRFEVVSAIGRACQEIGFFQVINHGVEESLISELMRVAREFFELPMEERNKFVSEDMMKAVRYGTSFNYLRDQVYCWRDFLKHYCHPLDKMLPLWPSNPSDYRSVVSEYSKKVRLLGVRIMSAIVESLGLPHKKYIVENGFSDKSSQVMVLNYYPACPEPELTLGMPPHSDYGCLTILLQDSIGGFQLLHDGQWKAVRPLPNSFIVNIGDHIEILSNGQYKSVVHRVVVNSEKLRISVAALMSMPFEEKIGPAPELIDEHHPALYRATNFAEFMDLLTSKEYKARGFLDSIRHTDLDQRKS